MNPTTEQADRDLLEQLMAEIYESEEGGIWAKPRNPEGRKAVVRIECLLASTEAQAAEIARLREALEPFARINVPSELRHRNIAIGDERIVSIELPFAPHEQTVAKYSGRALSLCLSLDGINVGDLRRARAALKGDRHERD